MTAASLVRTARRHRALDQRELAARARVSQPQLSLIESGKVRPRFDTVERVLRSTGQRLIAIPTVRDDAAGIGEAIGQALDSGDEQRAFRLFIQLSDDLAAEHGAVRFALGIAEPPPTGRKQWDAALAALVAHHFDAEGLPLPSWANSSDRILERAWTPGDEYTVPPPAHRVPQEFLARRVLIDEDTLASA